MILDTCALLWLAAGDSQLSDSTRDLIENATFVGISSISAFELGQKYQRGKLTLPAQPSEWFQTISKHHTLTVVDISAAICLQATELPKIHKDPFDRLIIATALSTGRRVVTNDSVFSLYGVETIS